jgi:hypothetical protein
MIFRKLQNSPQKAVPVAMMFVVVGLSLIVLAMSWSRFAFPLTYFGHDWNDFAHGFLYGLAIAMEILGLVIVTTAASAKTRKP